MSDIELTRQYADTFIAASEAVRSELLSDISICSGDVRVVHSFLGEDHGRTEVDTLALRESLGVPHDAYVLVACGAIRSGKGADLIPTLLRLLSKRLEVLPGGRTVHLIWVGAEPPDAAGLRNEVEEDLRKLNLLNRVHFVGSQARPREYFAAADAFVLLSRSESLSLVLLEAALEEVPGVCFDATGGPKEFVEQDAGFVVPYLDLDAMSEALSRILTQSQLRHALGRRAREKVLLGYVVGVAGPNILNQIESAMGTCAPRNHASGR
uniref:glycosyltransferase n=1 Tax=Humisphaera borealis TaxID=2807512 RepID=UPI0036F39575